MRQLCAATLLQFLLDYPLGPKRLHQHLAFLITNAAYEYEQGRLQVLEMLMQVGWSGGSGWCGGVVGAAC